MNELEYLKYIKARCRPPIREAVKYNNNNNMAMNSNSPTINHKVDLISNEYNHSTDSHSDCNSTSSKSSIDDTFERNYSSKCISPSKDQSHHNASKAKEDSKTSFFSYDSIRMLIMIVFILLVCHLYFLPICFHGLQNNHNGRLTQNLYENRREMIKVFRKSLEYIQLKFKNQNFDTWRVFASQIEEVINESTQISVIILLGNETNTMTCLAHLLGRISSKALSNANYLTLNARNIGNNHGKIIDKLKAEIQIDRVVVIEDLLTINSEAVKVLHYLCDKENPLVSKTVYIITIVSSEYKGSHKDAFVENCLTAKFSKAITLDILNPLITRIMDGPIISVLPESSMKKRKTIEECLLL